MKNPFCRNKLKTSNDWARGISQILDPSYKPPKEELIAAANGIRKALEAIEAKLKEYDK